MFLFKKKKKDGMPPLGPPMPGGANGGFANGDSPTFGQPMMPPPGGNGMMMPPPGGNGMMMPPPGGNGMMMPPPPPPPGGNGMMMPPPGGNYGMMPPPGNNGMMMPPPGGNNGMMMPPPGGNNGMMMPPPGGNNGMMMPPPGGNGMMMPPPGGNNMMMPPPKKSPQADDSDSESDSYDSESDSEDDNPPTAPRKANNGPPEPPPKILSPQFAQRPLKTSPSPIAQSYGSEMETEGDDYVEQPKKKKGPHRPKYNMFGMPIESAQFKAIDTPMLVTAPQLKKKKKTSQAQKKGIPDLPVPTYGSQYSETQLIMPQPASAFEMSENQGFNQPAPKKRRRRKGGKKRRRVRKLPPTAPPKQAGGPGPSPAYTVSTNLDY